MGGIERHVQCLAKTILEQGEALHATAEVLIVGKLGPIGEAMQRQGVVVHSFGCASCHDWRIFPKLHRLMKSSRFDIVCMQGLMLFPTLYFKLFATKIPLVRSIHTATVRERFLQRFLWLWLGRRFDWHLPVSSETWRSFVRVYPWAEGRGEVFFNPLRVSDLPAKEGGRSAGPVVGMVGRMADVKDVPSFIRICHLVRQKLPNAEFWVVGDGPLLENLKRRAVEAGVPIKWYGQRDDAKSIIGQMDVFVMTSKHEELPTTVLEAFGMRTAICGFIPDGGLVDVLNFSEGPVARAFQRERSCEGVAATVIKLLTDESMRTELVGDGQKIFLDHFSAERNVPELVREILPNVIAMKERR